MSSIETQYLFLSHLQEVFADAELETKLESPTDDAPFYTLIVEFVSLGKGNYTVNLQFSFLPINEQVNYEIYILQAFIELENQVDPSINQDLLWLTAQFNTKSPLGTFGLHADSQLLYFKHNCVLDFQIRENLDLYTKLIERQCDMLLLTLNLFIDELMQVANGNITAKEALKLNKLAALFN